MKQLCLAQTGELMRWAAQMFINLIILITNHPKTLETTFTLRESAFCRWKTSLTCSAKRLKKLGVCLQKACMSSTLICVHEQH